MLAITTPEIRHFETPPPNESLFPTRKSKSAVRHALRLWTSLHQLSSILDDLSDRQAATGRHPINQLGHPAPVWHHWPRPPNQACFHEWVHATHQRVFNCEGQMAGPILPIEAPSVKGLMIYAAKSGNIRFFGAWTQRSGVFTGWMRIQPHIAGIESDYAVGEVLGRPVFIGITLDLSGHDAIDRFVLALKNAAWDLGVAGG